MQVLEHEVVQEVPADEQQDQVRELSLIELSWVGGGTGTMDASL